VTTTAVVVCTRIGLRDDLVEESEAALTLGRNIAALTGGELRWLVLGPASDCLADIAARHGVACVDRIQHEKINAGLPDAVIEALAHYCTARPVALLLFNQTFETRVVAPRIAGRMDGSVVMNAVDVGVSGTSGFEVTAAAYGGDTRVVCDVAGGRPCVVALLANAVPDQPVGSSAVTQPVMNDVAVDLDGVAERIRVVQAAHAEGPRLEDAEIVVSGGRGLGVAKNFALVEELAGALGGLTGASRPLVDDGWIDPSHQVGLTGKITRPRLYLAAGISGATQHMVGCSAAKTIVAINTDADAPIFRHARYGIVGDCVEVLRELIRAANEMGVS
jgi:electron transfer flavoprotein alpha subunit